MITTPKKWHEGGEEEESFEPFFLFVENAKRDTINQQLCEL
jgi:hypothetical protein